MMNNLNKLHSVPLISVIITVHQKDDKQFFLEALKSIVDQTYSNLEILVVADGPIDSEFKAHISEIDFYAAKLKQRYVLSELKRDIELLVRRESEGPGKARNDGISKVTGEYIAIMDSDDISAPERIHSQYTYLSKNNLDLVSSSYIKIDKHGNHKGVKDMPLEHNEIMAMCPFLCPINNPAVFAKRSVLLQHRYEEGLRFGEDYSLWIRLLKNGYRLGNHPDYLIYFRENEDFYSRRRGRLRGYSDFKNKFSAITLASPVKWPLVFLFALITFLVRVSPQSVLEVAYKVRGLITSKSKKITTSKPGFRGEMTE